MIDVKVDSLLLILVVWMYKEEVLLNFILTDNLDESELSEFSSLNLPKYQLVLHLLHHNSIFFVECLLVKVVVWLFLHYEDLFVPLSLVCALILLVHRRAKYLEVRIVLLSW